MKARLLACLAFLPSAALAGAGKDGFAVLRLQASPRQAATAEACAAPDADVFAADPGALGLVRAPEVSFSRAALPLEVSLNAFSYVHPTESGAWSARAVMLDYGGLAGYDDAGNPSADVDAKDLVAGLSYGRRLEGGVAWAVGAKQVRQTIGRDAGSVWAADLGASAPMGAWPVRLSAAVKNVGGQATFVEKGVKLPRSLEGGAILHVFSNALSVGASLRQAQGVMAVHGGLEFWAYNSLALRAGYASERELGGVSAGLGLRLGNLRIDYAFLPETRGFEAAHRMGFSLRFGGVGEKAYQEGLALAQRGDHARAIFKFKEALDADPGHKAVMRALRESIAALEKSTGGDR